MLNDNINILTENELIARDLIMAKSKIRSVHHNSLLPILSRLDRWLKIFDTMDQCHDADSVSEKASAVTTLILMEPEEQSRNYGYNLSAVLLSTMDDRRQLDSWRWRFRWGIARNEGFSWKPRYSEVRVWARKKLE